jgi:hypothetical protein
MVKKYADRNDLIAHSLRQTAWRMCDKPDEYSIDEGKTLDRALRSCGGISDIDVVWVQWRYVGVERGWMTHDELVHNGKTGYRYLLKEDEG